MKIKNKIFLALIARKNRQIRFERDRVKALEQTNDVLGAYVGLLVARCGGAMIPKSLVRDALGHYKMSVRAEGDCYTVSVRCDSEETDGLAAESIKIGVADLSSDACERGDIEDGKAQI